MKQSIYPRQMRKIRRKKKGMENLFNSHGPHYGEVSILTLKNTTPRFER